jgi:aspartate/methionine/tyrosine aminotransferase
VTRSAPLNPNIVDYPPSDRLKIVAAVEGRTDLADLSSGNPNFPVPPFIVDRLQKEVEQGYAPYPDYFGDLELRVGISNYLESECGVKADPRTEILVTHGVQQGLYLVMGTLLKPGDEVLLPSPHYGSYEINANLCGAKPVLVPLREEDGFEPDIAAMEDAVSPRTRAVIFSNPHNPLGILWPRRVLEGIAEFAQRFDLLVLVDEVYHDYFDNPLSIGSLPGMAGRTFTFNGFSKSHMLMGLRMGYVAGPADLMQYVQRFHHSIAISTSSLGQAAALAALECPADQVKSMYGEIQDLVSLLHRGVTSLPGVTCVKPESGFYLFPNFSSLGYSSLQLSLRLIEEAGVMTLPGTEFGPLGEGFLRLSVAAGRDDVEMGLERLGDFVARVG